MNRLLPFMLVAAVVFGTGARADDTDIYLNPRVASGAEPLVMFALDYRSNLGSTACSGSECDELIAGGYMPASGPYTFFDVLRGALKKVLDPLTGVKIGFMVNHADSCSGSDTAGPSVTNCSNGAYVLYGFEAMSAGSDDPDTYQTVDEDSDKVELFAKLDAMPIPGGTLNHSYQGKELYFELFRYLTGQDIYNGHLGYEDFGDTNRNTNLDEDFPGIAWDEDIETDGHTRYVSPLTAAGECTRAFVVNLMFQVSNQEDDSDDAITASKADGGMEGVNLSGRYNRFDTVISYLKDVDLADGTFGEAPDYAGTQNVTSYFLVDPTKINTTTNGYADAGGTGVALELSEDPGELIDTLNNIFSSILSVSTTFVAPSVPVNVFNRAQVVNEVFMALFEADQDGYPMWDGNLKKLRIGVNAVTGAAELQDVNGINAIDIDGRIKREAVTYWTSVADLPAPVDDEVAGADGRSVTRGGAGQRVPGFIPSAPGLYNSVAGARQLYTEDPSDATDGLASLNADTVTATMLWDELTDKWSPAASAADYASASLSERVKAHHLLRFARGLEDDGATTRPWLLGDPLHSRPTPINYGARGGGYDADNPDIRVLMGTNDGLMHMFRNTDPSGAQDGAEAWAFAPRETIKHLDRLRANTGGTPVHPNSADGTATTLTIDLNSDGTLSSADGDKVYAYFGLRRGGKSIYALDVSDPDAPKMMWRIDKDTAAAGDFSELGQTWSVPQPAYVQVSGASVPVLVFGGGYNGDDEGDNAGDLGKDAANRTTTAGGTPVPGTDDDEGNAIYVVNALTGALVWKTTYGATAGWTAATSTFAHPEMLDAIASDAVPLDTSGDGYIDRIYVGDTGGKLWRVDLAGYHDHDSNPATPAVFKRDEPSVWSAVPILSVGRHVAGHTTVADDRRFFTAPDVAQTRDEAGPYDAIIIGSGDREDPNGDGVENWFYMFKDRYVSSGSPPPTTVEHASLADLSDNCLQDGSCASAPNLSQGWRISLADSGEKSLAAPLTVGGSIFFTTFSPTPSGTPCVLSEGTGRLYVVSLQDATAVFNFDTSNDLPSQDVLDRVDLLGSGGIPVEVVPLGDGLVLVQGQEAGENIVDTGARMGFKTYWHELYR